MSFNYQFRPIESWPGKATPGYMQKSRHTFRAAWRDTLDLLERELDKLRAKHVVILADVDQSQIRLDGMLRASANPRTPRVILSFDSKHGPLSYPCDAFDHWQANVRAIALSLEALRKVDRYGVTKRSEQYQGWAKIEDNSMPSDVYAAAQLLNSITKDPVDLLVRSRSLVEKQLRTALAMYHPDRNPDGAKMFKRLSAAKDIFGKHFATGG